LKTSTDYPNAYTAAELLGFTDEDFRIMERGDVVVPVKKCTVRDGVRILSIRCPYCGKIHTHGGGPVNLAPCLGHRLSHCTDKMQRPNDGYFLTDPAGRCSEAGSAPIAGAHHANS